ncbi:MAG: tetratricopeptide repeat protein [Phycisphaerae bacterium]
MMSQRSRASTLLLIGFAAAGSRPECASLLGDPLFERVGQVAAVRDLPTTAPPACVSLLGVPLPELPAGDARDTALTRLAAARATRAANPDDPDALVWLGRRHGYLWQMHEAIDVFTLGVERWPADARFRRHRGHRLISLRRFEEAIVDLEYATALLRQQPDAIEPDGAPNALNIPLTTLRFNVWYHLALARYLTGDFEGAARDFAEALCHADPSAARLAAGQRDAERVSAAGATVAPAASTRSAEPITVAGVPLALGLDDNTVAAADWLYMSLRRAGRDAEAAGVLAVVRPEMNIVENAAYHRRLLLYKGQLRAEQLLNVESATSLDLATYGYGVANWHLCNGDRARARELFERVTQGGNWPAFGFIAAEAELARERVAGTGD